MIDEALHKKTKVLYIVGTMRSGSTLLDLMLGKAKGYFSTGELNLIWNQAFVNNLLCGCGVQFRECEFWTDVVTKAFGGWEKIDARKINKIWLSIGRLRKYFFSGFIRLGAYHKNNRNAEYFEAQERLYKAVSFVSGCKIVVDSSKMPTRAYILENISSIDLYVLHLVRDSRAMAFSMQRKKIKPEVSDFLAYLPKIGLIKSAIIWNGINLVSHHLKQTMSRSDRYFRIKYEEFVENPEGTLVRIGEYVGVPIDVDFFIDSQTANFGVNHTVAGNPIRFKNGVNSIQLDDEWRYKMPKLQQQLVTVLTWPFLKLYGYI